MQIRKTWAVLAGFSLLCGLTASEWLAPIEAQGEVSSLQLQGMMYAAIGLGALALGWRESRWHNLHAAYGLRLCAGCGLFFCVPMIVLDGVSGRIPSTSVSALFAMTPVVVTLMIASRFADGPDLQRLLAPALMGLGGVLCVLPFGLPASQREWGAFAAVLLAVALAGVAAVWLHRLLRAVGFLEEIAVAGVCCAVFLLGWCGLHGELVLKLSALRGLISFILVARMIETLLMLWLLREMEPVRFSARYCLIALLTIVEGFVLLRPELTLRLAIGIVLLAVGAGWLLAARVRESETSLSLR